MMVDRCPEVNKIFILFTFIFPPFCCVSTFPQALSCLTAWFENRVYQWVFSWNTVWRMFWRTHSDARRWMPVQLLVTQRVGIRLMRWVTFRRAAL